MFNIGIMNKVLENIRSIRESKGFSQEYLAEILHMTQSKYARFERGATKTDLSTLELVANVFGMTLIDLFSYPRIMVDSKDVFEKGVDSEVKAVLQIELSKEKKEQVLKLVFGDNGLEIINK